MRMVSGRWEAVRNFSGLEEAKYANQKEWEVSWLVTMAFSDIIVQQRV